MIAELRLPPGVEEIQIRHVPHDEKPDRSFRLSLAMSEKTFLRRPPLLSAFNYNTLGSLLGVSGNQVAYWCKTTSPPIQALWPLRAHDFDVVEIAHDVKLLHPLGPHGITYLLALYGHSLSDIADDLGGGHRDQAFVEKVLRGDIRDDYVAHHVATLLELPVSMLWPDCDLYDDAGPGYEEATDLDRAQQKAWARERATETAQRRPIPETPDPRSRPSADSSDPAPESEPPPAAPPLPDKTESQPASDTDVPSATQISEHVERVLQRRKLQRDVRICGARLTNEQWRRRPAWIAVFRPLVERVSRLVPRRARQLLWRIGLGSRRIAPLSEVDDLITAGGPGLPPEAIKSELRKRGLTQSAVARRLGVSPSSVSETIRSPGVSRRIEQGIADVLGLYPAEIWPSRYPADGGTRNERSHQQ